MTNNLCTFSLNLTKNSLLKVSIGGGSLLSHLLLVYCLSSALITFKLDFIFFPPFVDGFSLPKRFICGHRAVKSEDSGQLQVKEIIFENFLF